MSESSFNRILCWAVAAAATWTVILWIITAITMSGCGPISEPKPNYYFTVRIHNDFDPRGIVVSIDWGYTGRAYGYPQDFDGRELDARIP